MENNAIVKLFTRHGAQLTIALPLDTALTAAHAANLLASVDALLAAGLTVEAPGTQPGEQVEEIGYVVRGAKVGDDGKETPFIDLYSPHDAVKFRIVTVYLNTPEDVAAFEQACGLKLDSLTVYDGEGHIERGKDARKDAKYVKRLSVPTKAVIVDNPAYREGEKKPKRKFARWHAAAPAPAPANVTDIAAARERLAPPPPAPRRQRTYQRRRTLGGVGLQGTPERVAGVATGSRERG